MAFLQADKTYTEYGLTIYEKLITSKSGVKYYSNRKLNTTNHKPEYITIHNTEDIDEASGTNDAEQYARATFNNNMGDVVVHYYIDETACWHILADDTVGWHAADGVNGPGNTKSVAIEIVMDGSGKSYDTQAEKRGALLAAILLHKYGLSIDRLKTHHDWYSKKYCPAYILPHWSTFVTNVKANLEAIKKQSGGTTSAQPSTTASTTTQKPATTTSTATSTTTTAIKTGDVVKIASNATYYNGGNIPSWVKNTNWIVYSVSGDRVVINKSQDGKNAIMSPINKKYLTVVTGNATFKPYLVRITENVLNIRKGAGKNYAVVGQIKDKGVYTIIQEADGQGASKWGLLKSKAGWISLDGAKKI